MYKISVDPEPFAVRLVTNRPPLSSEPSESLQATAEWAKYTARFTQECVSLCGTIIAKMNSY
jgi:hypothetical protein